MRAAIFLLCIACSDRARPPAPRAPEAAAPVAPIAASAPVAASGEWRDFDALPPGAIKRLGTQRYISRSAEVSIRNDGTLALADDDLGVIEIRTDGMYRVVVAGECSSSELVQYVGDELRARCGKQVHAVRGGKVSSFDTPCGWGDTVLSRSGEYLLCGDRGKTYEVQLFRWPATPMWKVELAQEPRSLHVSDAGDVAIVENEQVRVVRGGAVAWTAPLKIEWAGLDRAHLVGWLDDNSGFVRLALADGKVASRTPMKDYSVARNVAVMPDGGSYFVAVYGTYPGDRADTAETFRARVDAKTGKLLATWRGSDYEWGNAVSPDGRWGASVGVGRVLRMRLDDPKIPADRPRDGERPGQVAISGDSRTIGYVTSEARENELVLFDVESGKQRQRVPAPDFSDALELSPDGKRVAVAGRFGSFAIYDANGTKQCESDAIAGGKIWWRGSRIVTYFPGDNGDDCDEITEAAVVVSDDRCRVVKSHVVYGMIQLLDATADRTTVAMADWKNRCGSNYELKPWRAFAIDHKTGAKIAVPKLDAEAAKREKALEDGEEPPLVSADGRTSLALEYDHDAERSFAHCRDVGSKKTLVRHELPKGVGAPFAVASDGRWLVATDRGSLLVYRCR